jgi:hypothetical protein
MTPSSIDFAVQEYGHRLQRGDHSALADFTSQYGRLVQIVLSRIVRSNRARSRFERSILLHFRQVAQRTSSVEINSSLVDRICEAMLAYPVGPAKT